jgi:hypothetical protein
MNIDAIAIDKNTVIKNTSEPKEIRRIFVVAGLDVGPGLDVWANCSAFGFVLMAQGRIY